MPSMTSRKTEPCQCSSPEHRPSAPDVLLFTAAHALGARLLLLLPTVTVLGTRALCAPCRAAGHMERPS